MFLCRASAKDADGNATYTKDDLTRASKEDIAKCDYVLVGMNAAYTASYDAQLTSVWVPEVEEKVEEEWYPASLQYKAYKAEDAIVPSISGVTDSDGKKENRSYKGKSTPDDFSFHCASSAKSSSFG